jgi:hypothetical protein
MPALVLLLYPKLSPSSEWDREAVHDIHVVLCVCSGGLVGLFCAEIFARPEFLLAAAISFAAHLAIIGLVRRQLSTGTTPSFLASIPAVLGAWCVQFIPYAFFAFLWRVTALRLLLDLSIGLVGIVIGVIVYRLAAPAIGTREVDLYRWRCQAVAAATGALLALVPIAFRLHGGTLHR